MRRQRIPVERRGLSDHEREYLTLGRTITGAIDEPYPFERPRRPGIADPALARRAWEEYRDDLWSEVRAPLIPWAAGRFRPFVALLPPRRRLRLSADRKGEQMARQVTEPMDPVLAAFAKIANAAAREAELQGLRWWAPGDGQSTSVIRDDDGWVIARIGMHELFRCQYSTLADIAESIRLARH